MSPKDFKGVNIIIGKGQKEYNPLPAMSLPTVQGGPVVTCWELSDEELRQIKKSREIWVMQLTFNKPLQPFLISSEKPFNEVPGKKDK